MLKNLHTLFNFNLKRAKLLIMMHFNCLLPAKIISIYVFSACKILLPEIFLTNKSVLGDKVLVRGDTKFRISLVHA